MTPRPRLLYPLLALMILCWSLNFIAGKIALRGFPPLLLGAVRTSLAGGMMLPVYFWMRRRGGIDAWTLRDVPILLPLGVLGIAMNQILFVVGLNRTSVAHAAILSGLTPLLVLVFAALLGMERFAPRRVAGMCVALAGVALINLMRSRTGSATVAGDAFVLLGNLTLAVFTIAGKRFAVRFGAITVCTFAYVGGALVLSPLTFALSRAADWSAIAPSSWAAIVFMAAFPAVACYLIYYWALNYTSASRVASLQYLQPPLATLLAIPLLGEPVTVPIVAGGALVLFGVYLSGRSS